MREVVADTATQIQLSTSRPTRQQQRPFKLPYSKVLGRLKPVHAWPHEFALPIRKDEMSATVYAPQLKKWQKSQPNI
jgi:hypothetical protein